MEQEIFLLKMLGYAVPKIYLDIFKKAVWITTRDGNDFLYITPISYLILKIF
jgi:hypothetical protein